MSCAKCSSRAFFLLSPPKGRNSVKPLLVVSDCARQYRPLFFNRCYIPCQLDILDSGSPFQDATISASKKIRGKGEQFCEHCEVIATNISEHVDSEIHIKHSRKAENFTELDSFIMELSLENLLAVKEKDSNTVKKTII